jgi:hypothetical protein
MASGKSSFSLSLSFSVLVSLILATVPVKISVLGMRCFFVSGRRTGLWYRGFSLPRSHLYMFISSAEFSSPLSLSLHDLLYPISVSRILKCRTLMVFCFTSELKHMLSIRSEIIVIRSGDRRWMFCAEKDRTKLQFPPMI